MIAFVHRTLLGAAAYALFAVCAAVITDTNPYPAGIILVCAAAAVVLVHQLEYRRDRRMADGRAQVWRDREAGLS